jgi:hypothetical protein
MGSSAVSLPWYSFSKVPWRSIMPEPNDRKARQDELIAANVCVGMAVLILAAMATVTFLI